MNKYAYQNIDNDQEGFPFCKYHGYDSLGLEDGKLFCQDCLETINDPDQHCKSCGVAFVEHLGLAGTCKELQEQKKIAADNLRQARDWEICYKRKLGLLEKAEEREKALILKIRELS